MPGSLMCTIYRSWCGISSTSLELGLNTHTQIECKHYFHVHCFVFTFSAHTATNENTLAEPAQHIHAIRATPPQQTQKRQTFTIIIFPKPGCAPSRTGGNFIRASEEHAQPPSDRAPLRVSGLSWLQAPPSLPKINNDNQKSSSS